jgi:hypothetical protein
MIKAQSLCHPNILKVYDYIEGDKYLYEITEALNEEPSTNKKNKLVKKAVEYIPRNLLEQF